MPDSDALRMRRHRAHKAGDHHLCKRDCAQAAVAPLTVVPPAGELDPRAELEALAGRLAAAHQADPRNGVLARELRQSLALLLELAEGSQPVDPLAELRAMMDG